MLKLSDLWLTKDKSIFLADTFDKQRQTINCRENSRIKIITQFYPPDFAATGQLIQELSIQLSKQGIEVDVFTGQPGYAFTRSQAPAEEQINSLKVKRSRLTKLWSRRIRGKAINGVIFCLRAGLNLCRHRDKNTVLLLTTAPPFLSVLGYLANLCFGLPYVCLIYDLYPDAATELNVLSVDHFITKLWDKVNDLVWQKAQGMIVLSSTMKSRIINKHPQVADKISVIHNWADAEWIRPISKQKNWFARQHGLNQKFTVLYSGNLGRCHDVETILAAIELLKDDPIQFVFIGAGAKQQTCLDTIENLGLHNCLFLPYQDREHLPYSLTACDLAFVSIAPGLEGIVAPSKLYGIMAAGRAIATVCDSQSYLRSLIDNAACGACFEHNDSQGLADFIRSLALNPALAIAMGQAGRKYLEENFTPDIIARQYREVLHGETETISVNVDSSIRSLGV
ncbi:MAG: glycosyltransferase family 4 protein [Xenococcaceae cyanobacterium MO_188.B32]|nr:glycosyltransferase family 4 protein [Xenococcaceae cyanobacterium MO_188.B32]